jgi:phage I-like protein
MINKKLTEICLLETNNSIPEEIQLLREGTFDDFWTGKFTIDKKMLKEMKKNFDDNVRGIDLAIDIAHMNYMDAAGWIKDVELKENDSELWAKIAWTELGIEKVQKKLFRYLSSEFDTRYKDNESGIEFGYVLLGAGLTNRPFVKGMKPTTNLTEEKKMEEKIKELQESNVKLSEELKKLQDNIKSLSDEKENLVKENLSLKSEIETSKKEHEFQAMLQENKVVPAQKEAWIKGDLVEFAKNASSIKINTEEKGSGQAEGEGKEKVSEDLLDAARVLSEKSKISMSKAISELLSSDEFKHLN